MTKDSKIESEIITIGSNAVGGGRRPRRSARSRRPSKPGMTVSWWPADMASPERVLHVAPPGGARRFDCRGQRRRGRARIALSILAKPGSRAPPLLGKKARRPSSQGKRSSTPWARNSCGRRRRCRRTVPDESRGRAYRRSRSNLIERLQVVRRSGLVGHHYRTTSWWLTSRRSSPGCRSTVIGGSTLSSRDRLWPLVASRSIRTESTA